MIKGHENVQVSIVQAFDMINRWKGAVRQTPAQSTTRTCRGVCMFAQRSGRGFQKGINSGSPVSVMDRRLLSYITCYQCGSKGHYSDNQPQTTPENNRANAPAQAGNTLMKVGVCLAQVQ